MIQRKKHKKEIITELNERIALLEDDCIANRQAYLKMQKAYKNLEHDYNDLANSYNVLSDMYHKELEKQKSNKFRGYQTETHVGLSPEDINLISSGYSNGMFSRNVITDIITDRRTTPSHGDIYYKDVFYK